MIRRAIALAFWVGAVALPATVVVSWAASQLVTEPTAIVVSCVFAAAAVAVISDPLEKVWKATQKNL